MGGKGKRLIRKVTAVISVGVIMACAGISASAYALFPGKLEGGIYNRTYAIEAGVSFIDCITQAIDDWNWVLNANNDGQGVDFYFHRISGENIIQRTQIYIRSQNYSEIPYAGLTVSYKDDSPFLDIPYEDFDRSIITINEAQTPTYNYFQEMRKIIGHEIGHSIGLAHNTSDNGTLMYPGWDVCTAYCPTLDDITGVRVKYQ